MDSTDVNWSEPERKRRLNEDGYPISDEEWAQYEWLEITNAVTPADAHVYMKIARKEKEE